MTKKLKQLVVPREKALFRLDERGRWHGEGGEFLHPKIIDHFHGSIRKDAGGFHLMQKHRNFVEKVYFPFEDTPLFVFDVRKGEGVHLVLNTKRKIKLMARKLYIRNDHLYLDIGEDRVKFTEQALVKISPFLEFEENRAFIRVKGRRYRIPER
jgi:hypothetical protein